MIGYLVAFILVGVGVYYAYYLKQKVRIDKKYAIKILEKSFPDDSFSEENVSIKRSGEIKHEDTEINEMVFFKVYATSDESKEYDLEIRRYNPQADIEAKEYEEFQKGAKAEDSVTDSVLSGSPDAANTATIESAQSMMQEQSKREEEDKLIRSRILQHELGIKIAKILSQKSRIIPEIYYYDKRKYCSLIEYPGSTLLKDYFEEIDEEAKESSIIKIINNIAKIHNSFSDISVYLPPRRDMEPEDLRAILKKGLDSLYEARLISSQQRLELLNEYYTVASYLSNNYLKNVKLEGFTPYKLIVNNDDIFINEFYSFDVGPQLTNVVEFIKDPIIYNKQLEKEALASYFNLSKLNLEYKEFIKYYHLFSCHILAVQLLYMKLYFKRIEEHKDTIEEEDILVNWDIDHFNMLYEDAKSVWQKYDESKFFIDKLEEIISAI